MKLKIKQFFKHRDVALDFKGSGLTVIYGPNGSGKSSYFDAMTWCIYGKTLRKGAVKKGTSVTLEIPGVITIKRTTAGVEILPREKSGTTNTNTQELINAKLGIDLNAWRKTCVFTKRDKLFSASTDAERKRLIESLLGMDDFDAALKDLRDERRDSQSKLSAYEESIASAVEMHRDARERWKKAAAYSSTLEVFSPSGLSLDDCTSAVRKAVRLVKSYKSAADDAREAWREAEKAAAAQDAVWRGHYHVWTGSKGDVCITCKRPLGEPNVKMRTKSEDDKLRKAVEDERKKHSGLRFRATKAKEDADAHDDAYDVFKSKLYKAESALDNVKNERKVWAKTRKRARREASESRAQMLKYKAKRDDNATKLDSLRVQIERLDVLEQVLGLEGARPHILAESLAVLEESSNRYLSRIGDLGAGISLGSHTTSKTGKIRAKMQLEVSGLDGNMEGASDGEAQRINVSLFLGLGELTPPTPVPFPLVLDEVFDSLDDDGVDAMIELVADLSRHRPICVITHLRDLASRMIPDTLIELV